MRALENENTYAINANKEIIEHECTKLTNT